MSHLRGKWRIEYEKIINGDYLYIDKTEDIYKLITTNSYIFLSRPRCFGKSLLLSTIKELFEGLYIYDKWDWKDKYPVIYLTFDFKFSTLNDLEDKIIDNIKANAKRLGIEVENNNPSIMFSNLIFKTFEMYQKQVVILIDDWDRPIRDASPKNLKSINYLLLGIYIQIKSSDEYVKFAFATGMYSIENIVVREKILDSFDLDNLSLESVMFQSGYLAIKEIKERRNRVEYILDYPNLEVKISFNNYILNYFVTQIDQKSEVRYEWERI